MVTTRSPIVCPYCNGDLRSMGQEERINHKMECHIKHYPNGVDIVKTTQNKHSVTSGLPRSGLRG